ncbi:MAG: NAD(P)/FAD-dependent oxidoreductase [Thermomicrobiales bacterium]
MDQTGRGRTSAEDRRRSIALNASATGAGSRQPRVVIVGGGFAGLAAAKGLKNAPVQITLLDRRNHHLFQPLLYQVATAVLSPQIIAQPIRHILRKQANTSVLMEEVTGFDLDRRKVVTLNGTVPYDYLIVAAGANHSYFGNDQWEPMAPGLKTLEQATDIRSRVLRAFEEAEIADSPAARQGWLTFIIVGAGPTGVELAGSIAEIASHAMKGEFRRINPADAKVLLVEALDRVLPPFAPDLSAKAQEQLEALGVECRFGKPVKAIVPGTVTIGEEDVPCETVIWAAGVKASPLGAALGGEVDRPGRVMVTPELTLPGHPEVFVVGDLASLKINDKPVPGVAPSANQMGAHAAVNVKRAVGKQPLTPFVYKDKGSMAVVGRNRAVAQVGNTKFSGFFAWMAWMIVHLGYLNGIRNRLLATINWIALWFTYNRGGRLVTHYSGVTRSAENERG